MVQIATSCVVAGAVLRGAFRALCLLVGARVAPTPTPTSPPQGVRNVASVCLQIGYPTIASVPHSIVNGYKRVLAVAVETDYTFPLAEKVSAALPGSSGAVGCSWGPLLTAERWPLWWQSSHPALHVVCPSSAFPSAGEGVPGRPLRLRGRRSGGR